MKDQDLVYVTNDMRKVLHRKVYRWLKSAGFVAGTPRPDVDIAGTKGCRIKSSNLQVYVYCVLGMELRGSNQAYRNEAENKALRHMADVLSKHGVRLVVYEAYSIFSGRIELKDDQPASLFTKDPN